MRALIEKFNQCNVTKKQFCRQEGIPLSVFYYWQKKYKKGSLILLSSADYYEMLRLKMDTRIMLTNSVGLQEECCVLESTKVRGYEDTKRRGCDGAIVQKDESTKE